MESLIGNKDEFKDLMKEYYNGEEFNKKEYFFIKFFIKALYILTHEVWFFLIYSIPTVFVLIYLVYSFNSPFVTFVFMSFHIIFYKFIVRKYFFKNMKKEHEEYRFILEFFKEMESENKKGNL